MELKKSLGQHFLIDQNVLTQIYDSIVEIKPSSHLIEVGPGMGALTRFIKDIPCEKFSVIEKDDRFVQELPTKFGLTSDQILHQDVLTTDFSQFLVSDLTVVGNYPYNISNMIMFLIIENSQYIKNSVGMFQKEVARRIASPNGTKEYGILSVLTQSIYEVEYLFDIPPTAFDPPPKVMSGVLSMKRRPEPLAEYNQLKKLVKAAFNLRRKMLSNSLKGLEFTDETMFLEIKNLRPEQLSVDDFCQLSKFLK